MATVTEIALTNKPQSMRQNPKMEQTTVYLNRNNKYAMQTLLAGSPLNMSELLNMLMSQWVHQQKALLPPDDKKRRHLQHIE